MFVAMDDCCCLSLRCSCSSWDMRVLRSSLYFCCTAFRSLMKVRVASSHREESGELIGVWPGLPTFSQIRLYSDLSSLSKLFSMADFSRENTISDFTGWITSAIIVLILGNARVVNTQIEEYGDEQCRCQNHEEELGKMFTREEGNLAGEEKDEDTDE